MINKQWWIAKKIKKLWIVKFYTSKIKESENEQKLLLEKLPNHFILKKSQNSNDNNIWTQKKKWNKNWLKNISLDYSESSPDFKNTENIYIKKREVKKEIR